MKLAKVKLLRKIKIHRNGLNAITTPYYNIEYYIHTLDSIFISTIKNYYLLNSKGQILKKITPLIESKYIKAKKPIFDESTSYKKGVLSFKIDVDLPDKNSQSYLRRSYDFDKEIVIGDFVNENILVHNYNDVLDYKLLDLQRRGAYDQIFKFFVKLDDKLVASTSINDSIYVFDSNKKLINTFYAGNRNIKVSNFIQYFNRKNIVRMEQATAIEDKLEQPPFYTNMFIDDESGFIYRILMQGAKAVFNSTGLPRKEISVLKGASLIVIDLNSEKSYVFNLPVGEIQIPFDNSKIFCNKEGVHFPLIKQENRHFIVYKIFKVKNK